MADPVLDEAYIIDRLAAPVTVANLQIIQGGAVQALCDLYDRKVTREEFINLAAPVVSLYGQCAKLDMLDSIEAVFKSGDLKQEKFDTATKAMEDLIRAQAMKVTEIIKRLQLCPTSQDKVH